MSGSATSGRGGGLMLARVLARYWWVVVLMGLVAGLLGWGASTLRSTRYEATVEMLLATPADVTVFRSRSGGDEERRLLNEVERLESRPVLERASAALDGAFTPEAVRRSISVQSHADSDVVLVTASARTAEGAARIANTVAQAYQQAVAERGQELVDRASAQFDEYRSELETTVSNAETRLDELRTAVELQVPTSLPAEDRVRAVSARLAVDPEVQAVEAERNAALLQLSTLRTDEQRIRIDAALFGSGVELVKQAEAPRRPAQPRPKRDAALASMLGFVAAGAWMWSRAENLQDELVGRDVAIALGAPLLGEVPEFAAFGFEAPATSAGGTASRASQAYAFTLASLEFARAQTGAFTVMVTSPEVGDGKTMTAFNLAAAAARDGRRVILVDCDLRARTLSRQRNLDDARGLTELAATGLEHCLAELQLADGNVLPLVPAGSRIDPRAFLSSAGFAQAISKVEAEADIVILDAPPVLTVGDTSAMAARVHGIVVVVERGTPVASLEEMRWRLELTGTPMIGCVFNRVPQPRWLTIIDRATRIGKTDRTPRSGGTEATQPLSAQGVPGEATSGGG